MSDIEGNFEKLKELTRGESPETKELSSEKTPTSDTAKTPHTSLDPTIARRVAASLEKHHEALEYLKNN